MFYKSDTCTGLKAHKLRLVCDIRGGHGNLRPHVGMRAVRGAASASGPPVHVGRDRGLDARYWYIQRTKACHKTDKILAEDLSTQFT
jgi:hypothetical protein